MRRTKIICTMGPATDNEDVLRQRRRLQRPLPQSWPLKMPQMLPVPPQPKRQRFPSLPHLPLRRQQLFLLQKQHLHPKRIDAAANQCYTQS